MRIHSENDRWKVPFEVSWPLLGTLPFKRHFVAHFRVGGVVISIGSVKLASLPRVIDDQNVFHLDALITQAVFRSVRFLVI